MPIKYRPEIDGLRAIAVLAVVFFHAEFVFRRINPFKGGFIGVDVFFVISGYLITSVIISDLSRGQFSFKNFYERRVRRILPALFFIMLASIPAALVWLSPKEMAEFAWSILTSLFFSSNILFWQENSYWAEPSHLKPFLHTWSLSIEEQFYLVFPLLFLFMRRFLSHYIALIVGVLGLVSLIFADFFATRSPEMAFFLLPTRSWELLAGVLLAQLEHTYGRRRLRYIGDIAPLCGLVLICAPMALFSEDTVHPSYLTGLPILGTMLLIWFAREGELVTRLLSSKVLVAVGLISYSLYLWHYPVFVFARISENFDSRFAKAGWVGLSVVLSILTYYAIERPFRNRSLMRARVLWPTTVGLFSTVLGFTIFALATDGNVNRFTAEELRFLDRVDKGFTKFVDEGLPEKPRAKIDKTNFPKLLIIGDSFARDFYNVLDANRRIDEVDDSIHIIRKVCRNVPYDTPGVNKGIEHKKACKNIERVGDPRLAKKIAAADGVILVSSWNNYTRRHVGGLVKEVNKLGVDNVIVVGRKQFPKTTIKNIKSLGLGIIKARLKVRPKPYAVAKKMREANIKGYLDLHGLICGPTPYCPISTPEGNLISFDGYHLTPEGAKFVGDIVNGSKVFNDFWSRLKS